MNRDKFRNNLSFWLSLIAIILSLCLIILWIVNVSNVAVVSLDSFVGVVVALLALLVTIVLGWQIYNAIDIREKVHAIDSLQSKMKEQEHRMEQMYYNACHSHAYVSACQSSMLNDDVNAFRWLMNSLCYSLLMDEPLNVELILEDMQNCVQHISQSQLDKNLFVEIENDHKTIINTHFYICIANRYNLLYNAFISKVLVK